MLASVAAEAAARGLSVTRRLLGFARRDALVATVVEVAPLLTNLQEVLRHTLGSGIDVRVEAPQGLFVLADRAQLEVVLVNLATNARDAMPEGGVLTLSAEAAGEDDDAASPAYVRFTATDTGCGMDAATLARTVEPFFTTKPVGKGTGLGLAMARGFAEQSGGSLRISSEPGQGTTVRLWLPRAEGPGSAAPGPPDRMDAASPVAARQPPRLLLVEDDKLVREVLADELAQFGYRVLQAEDGHAALAVLEAEERVEVLLSDLSMPGMNGLELIRTVRQRHPGLPAILMTGYAGEAATVAISGALNESLSILRKPVSGLHLADRLAALLAARQEVA